MTTDLLDFPAIEAAPPIPATPPVPAPVAAPVPSTVATVTPSIKDTVLAQFKDAEVSILALAEKYRAVAFDVTTTKGMNEAKAARLELREKGRFAVQRAEKAVKADVNDLKRVMADEVDRLVAIVQPVEDAIDAQIKAEEERKAREKAERERIEAARIAGHQERMAKIGAYLTHCQQHGMTAARIKVGIDRLAAATFGPEWQEFAVPAANLQCETLAAMSALHAQAVEREAEALRLELERQAEADRLEAQRQEQARVAEAQAEAQRLLDAQAAEFKANMQRIASHQQRIAEIQAAATGHERTPSWDLFEAIAAVEALDVSDAQFQELAPLAAAAQASTLATLRSLKDAAVVREEARRQPVEPAIGNPPFAPTAQPGVQTPAAQGEVAGNLAQPQPGAPFTSGDAAVASVAGDEVAPNTVDSPAPNVTLTTQQLLAEACDLLDSWVSMPFTKKRAAECFAQVSRLRTLGNVPRYTNTPT